MPANRQQYTYINHDSQFTEFCESLKDSSIIGIDTEFVRENSYYPVFCLLQISCGSSVACVDPLSISSMEPLRAILANPAILKILHSCRQDIEVLFHLFGELPVHIHDTQIAAALAGIAEHIGYSSLTEHLLGIHLSKDETRTDWSARPLTSRQLRYAAEDVAYLQENHRLLMLTLTQHQRLQWLDEDCQSILSPDLYTVQPANAWRRLKGVRNLSHSQISRLKILAEWRERVAQTTNIPRTWVMKDDVTYMLARGTGIKLSSIPAIRGVKSKDQKKYIDDLMSDLNHAITVATMSDSDLPWESHIGSDAARKSLLNRMSLLIKNTSSELGISPSTLGTRNDLEHLLEAPARGRLTTGWRYEVVGKLLKGFINVWN